MAYQIKETDFMALSFWGYEGEGIMTESEEIAWPYDQVIKLVAHIQKEKRVVILGGDVLNLDLSYTLDNWHFNPSEDEPLDILCEKGCEATLEYLRKYKEYNKNLQDYLYVLVVTHNPHHIGCAKFTPAPVSKSKHLYLRARLYIKALFRKY